MFTNSRLQMTCVLTMLLFSTVVSAQVNVLGEPVSGSYSLDEGFSPDPMTYTVQAGGTVRSVLVDPNCQAGFIGQTPSIRIHYTAGAEPLRFFVDSDDTNPTLAINSPEGVWYCSQDAVGLMPLVDFLDPADGQYDIFVGTVEPGEVAVVTLFVSGSLAHGPREVVPEPVSFEEQLEDEELSEEERQLVEEARQLAEEARQLEEEEAE